MLAHGLNDDPRGAVAAKIAAVEAAQGGGAANRMTCLLSDGARIIGFRHSGDGHAPARYLSRGPLDYGARALAPEPLDGLAANWLAGEEGGVVTPSARAALFGRLPPLRPGPVQAQSTSLRKM